MVQQDRFKELQSNFKQTKCDVDMTFMFASFLHLRKVTVLSSLHIKLMFSSTAIFSLRWSRSFIFNILLLSINQLSEFPGFPLRFLLWKCTKPQVDGNTPIHGPSNGVWPVCLKSIPVQIQCVYKKFSGRGSEYQHHE